MSVLTTDMVKVLQKESADAVGIFNNVLRELQNTNKKIRQQKATRLAKIKVLTDENTVLDRLESQNSKYTDKINKFLGVGNVELEGGEVI